MTPELLDEPVVTQLLVPGRGIELNSDAFPGTVQFDSAHSQGSWERAVAAANYTKLHRSVGRVVFSGEMSFMVPEDERPDSTEAAGMDIVAQGIFPVIPSWREEKSRTSYGNLVEGIRSGLLDPSQTTGVVIHEDHAERFLKAARLVMPFTNFVVIPADRPGNTEMRKPSRSDRIADVLYGIAMFGVQAGDVDTIARRDEMVQRNVLRAVSGLRKVTGPLLARRKLSQDQLATAA